MKRFLFGWGLGAKVMQVLVLILVMLFSWMSPGAVVEVQAYHEGFMVSAVLLTASPRETVKDLYGYTGPIYKDVCGVDWKDWWGSEGPVAYVAKMNDLAYMDSTDDREAAHQLAREFALDIENQQVAYKKARAAGDYEASALLTPWNWVGAWQNVREAKDLIDSVNPKDGLSSEENADLEEAGDLYKMAYETAQNAAQCNTPSLTRKQVEGQVLLCLAKIRSGQLYIDRCVGAKPWPTPTPTN